MENCVNKCIHWITYIINVVSTHTSRLYLLLLIGHTQHTASLPMFQFDHSSIGVECWISCATLSHNATTGPTTAHCLYLRSLHHFRQYHVYIALCVVSKLQMLLN
jgi:hypothetical protein